MYVCICNAVTDDDIRQAADAGCGSCLDMVAEMLGQSRAVRELPLPLLRAA